jgi:tetratricopeptide (TPR) repeat protein
MMRQIAIRFLTLAAAVLLIMAPAAAADSVSGTTNQGYGRLLFTLTENDQVSAQVNGSVLTIHFGRKVAISPVTITAAIPGYISNGRVDADGKTYRFALTGDAKVHVSSAVDKFVVDVTPLTYQGMPPDLPKPVKAQPKPVDVANLPVVKVRSGAYQNFTRVVFDWPKNVPYKVFGGSGKLTVTFEEPTKLDFSAIDRQAPPWVKSAGWHLAGRTTVVDLAIDYASGYHDFRDGTHVVVDVLAPKTDADSYNPPGQAKPSVTSLQPGKAPAPPVATAPPAKLAANAPKPAPATKAAPATPAPVAPPATADKPMPEGAGPPPPPEPPADPNAQLAAGHLTKDGAVLQFAGGARQGVAVFTRGLNAWIILQTNQPLDTNKLKSQLGNFPIDVEASSGDGTMRLRIGLRQPEQIAAYAEGSNLKVVIAKSVTPTAVALGFARNQEKPTHSTISTLLSGATKVERVIDPQAGDELLVVPGMIGRAVTAPRDYIEFSALETGAGLVVMPYVDDLAVGVQGSRVTISRPDGLSLTPAMLPNGTPDTLATNSISPSFLDFAKWQKVSGGSFLATERRLRAAIARLPSEQANRARLALARFYLANRFAAEALGVIGVMQSVDPGLSGDMQLQTMKAVASLLMGRPRDAHNALAGAQFDSDRHAALWRGLTDVAMEKWDDARTNLDRAASVLGVYVPEVQARVRMAAAEAALATAHPEVADAELEGLPQHLEGDLALQAKLDKARLYAAQHQTDKSDPLFDELQTSGNERFAALAIYYRVTAGLADGSLKPQQAINALERLRFRWRGDLLEIKTLRTLAGIYFSQKRWREGLITLHVVTDNFPTEDVGIQAMDDMRTAFVNLFLHGEADKLAPVAALGLFYDFIELTPIGADGDEMIRKMADRLVKVDLLGPAADLLNYQVTKRLDGVARAQVATKLAMVQMMDHKPAAVLDTLRSTQISTLPDDVQHQRLLMEARALTEQKHYDHALDLLAVDQQPDTQSLRAEIYWKSGAWPQAGQAVEQALGERYKDDKPLTDLEREEVMRAAVSYSLANDQASLDRLRTNFMPKMKGTPNATGFAVVTERIDLQGVAFRDAAAKVAAVDTLKLFMSEMQNKKR